MQLRTAATAVALVAALVAAAEASETWIYLVDAKYQAPLEFLQKTADERRHLGHTIHYGSPQSVYIDGQERPFERYNRMDPLQDDDEDDPGGAEEFEADLGMAGPKPSTVKSDGRTKVETGTGIKALIKADLADGKHLLHPGSIQFTARDSSIVDHPSFVKTGPTSYNLLCYPVDLNLLPNSGEVRTRVSVNSGKHRVYQRLVHGRGSQAARVYLPASATGYRVRVRGHGELTLSLSAAGVQFIGEPRLEAGYTVRCDGFAIGLIKLRRPEPVAPPEADGAELYLFTDRCREAYMEGERVQLSVRAFGPAAVGEIEVTLTEGARALSLGKLPLDRSAGAGSAELELDTALLRPGDYVVQAQVGQAKSNPLPLTVTRAIPKTNLKVFGHGKWGGGSYPVKRLKTLRDCGFNQLTHGAAESHGCGLVDPGTTALGMMMLRKIPTDPNRFRAYQRANFPPEMLEIPHEHQTGAEFMLRHGIDQKPILGVHLILYFNVGNYWIDHAENNYQSAQHLAQEWRRFPNFSGVTYCTGDGMTPATIGMVHAAAGVASFDVIHGERMKKLQEVFRAKVGDITIDDSATREEFERISAQMDGALGFGLGMEVKDRITGEDDKRLEWLRWVSDLYPNAYRNHREAIRRIVPDATVTGGSTWGWGIRGGMHPPMLYKDSDWVNNDQHGDFGTLAFHNITESDYAALRLDRPRTRTREVIDLIGSSWAPAGYKLFLQALSRNPVGIGVYNINHENFMAGAWGEQKERSEALARMADLAARFGDVYMELERVDEIAVIASFRQGVLGGQAVSLLNGAHYLTQKAGYQATMVTEAYCLRHPEELGKRYRALFLVNMTKPLTPKFKEVLTAFQENGGLVLGDAASKNARPGLVVVPHYGMRGSNTNDHWQIEQDCRPLAQQFQATVRPKLRPFFTTTDFSYSVIRSVDGDLEYWVAFNDAKDAKTGAEDGVYSQFTYQGGKTRITAARQGVLYDALRRQRVKTVAEAGGLSFESDLRYFPGTVYVLAQRPIAALRLNHSKQVLPGQSLSLKASALDDGKRAFTGHLPIELTVLDPAGNERYRLFRKTNEAITVKVAGNDTPGQWRVQAVEQATGLTVESAFAVTGSGKDPLLRKLDQLVLDADAVHDLVKNEEVEIVLYPKQLAGCEAIAKELERELLATGAEVRRRIIWPSLHRYYPMQWRYETVEDLELREGVLSGELVGHRVEGKNHEGHYRRGQQGEYAFYRKYTKSAHTVYYKNVILLGRADGATNPMLNLITRSRMMLRNPSASFPARGQGMVGYAWGPFHYGHDAVVVYGRDETGLRKAAGSLVSLVSGERPRRAYSPRPVVQGRENGQVYASMGCPAAPSMASATGKERDRTSLLPPVYGRTVVDAMVDADGRVLIKQLMQEDQSGPDLASIDLKTGKITQYILDTGLDELARMLAGELPVGQIPSDLHYQLDGDHLAAVAGGIGRFSPEGEPEWYFNPFPKPQTYEEAKYPRRCKVLTLSADRQWLLASFFDAIPAAGHGVSARNPGQLVCLNTKTGKPAGRIPRYLANRLFLSHDGSRGLVLDDVCYGGLGHRAWYRPILNPHEDFVLAAFDRHGRELCHFPVDHERTDKLEVDRGIAMALMSYTDARRSITVYDLEAGRAVQLSCPEIDVGLAVAPDGSFGVVTYNHGLVRLVDRSGKVIRETEVPAPGVPVVSRDGKVAVASHDGKLYLLDAKGAIADAIEFGTAPVSKPARTKDSLMPGLAEPLRPWWEQLPEDVETVELPEAPFPTAKTVTGEQSVTIRVPKMEKGDVLLLALDYAVQRPQERLEVEIRLDNRRHLLIYPYLAQPRRIGIPLRPRKAGPAKLVFRAPGGVRLSGGKLLQVNLGALGNAAYSPSGVGEKAENAGVPSVYIYNVLGQLGDPRCEQVVFGFTMPKLGHGQKLPPFPPGVTRRSKTDPNSYVDGKVYTGTPLYPTIHSTHGNVRLGRPQANLRSAQIVIEYEKPRTIMGLGIWEHPGAEPVADFALEACDKYEVSESLTRTLDGNWRLVCAGRGNLDYFHAHTFAPHKARVWRFTVVATPASAQRIAELEFYEDPLGSLDGGGDLDW